MPLTNGSGIGSGSRFGSGSCYFRHWPSKCQQKTTLKKVVLFITFWRFILHNIFKDKKSKKSNSRNQSFSYYFCLMIEGSGSAFVLVPLTSRSGSGSWRLKKHTDPDPQHCLLLWNWYVMLLIWHFCRWGRVRCGSGRSTSYILPSHFGCLLATGQFIYGILYFKIFVDLSMGSQLFSCCCILMTAVSEF